MVECTEVCGSHGVCLDCMLSVVQVTAELEFSAALIVTKELKLKIAKGILWTDSQYALHWIKTLSVSKEMNQNETYFCYVATDHNP